jgi:hypothetical protein
VEDREGEAEGETNVMKTTMSIAALAWAVFASSSAMAEETENQCKVRLMTTTKLVMGADTDAAGNIIPDSDPDSLQVVFLTKPEQGKSRVSDDGQMIFLNNATEDEQEALTLKAYDIRVKLGFCSRPPIKP